MLCYKKEFGHNETGYRTISYRLTDGTTGTFYYDDITVDTSDMSCFKGLETLHAEGIQFKSGDLKGLSELTELWCGNSIKEIGQFSCADRLKSVGTNTSLAFGDMEGVEKLSGIESLRINSRYIQDIKMIKNLKGLKSLTIINGNSIENFSVL